MDLAVTPYPRALERFERLRQSSLATFDRCALSEHFDQEFRSGWSSHPQARGTITHRVLAECLIEMHRQWKLAGAKPGEGRNATIEPDAALAIFYEVARQVGVDDRCGKCNAPSRFDPAKQLVVCEQGHELQSNFVNLPANEWHDVRWVVLKFARENSFDIEDLIDVEQRLYTTIQYPAPNGGHVERQLTGQLDALFIIGSEADHAIVLDWKDTWMLPAPTEVGFDGYFQQKFYAWLVMRNYPTVQRVTLREMYVRRSEPREADVWRSDLFEVEQMLSALVERYDRSFEEQNFPPSPGQHCHAMCARPDLCPIFPAVRTAGTIQTSEDALRYSREATVARAALNNRLKELKPWSNVHGPLTISDHKGPRVWGFHERTRIQRPERDELADALRRAGGRIVDVDAFLDSVYREHKQTKFDEHQPDSTTWMGQGANDEELLAALEESVVRNNRELPGGES